MREKIEKNMEKMALQTDVKEGEEVVQMLEQRFLCRRWRRA